MTTLLQDKHLGHDNFHAGDEKKVYRRLTATCSRHKCVSTLRCRGNYLLHHSVLAESAVDRTARSNLRQLDSSIHRARSLTGSAPRFSPSLPVQSSLRPVCRGFVSCVHYRGRRSRQPSKPSVRIVRSPTDLSVTSWPTSASEHFGQKIQPLTWLSRPSAACDRPSGFSVGTVNGRAMRPLLSSLKFLVGRK